MAQTTGARNRGRWDKRYVTLSGSSGEADFSDRFAAQTLDENLADRLLIARLEIDPQQMR